MKLVTWNVNGIRARKDDVLAFVEGERPDVLCLQEIKALSGQIPAPLNELPGYWCYWHGMKGYSGVALLVRKDFSTDAPRFSHPEFDHENRIVVADLLSDGGAVSVASIYVPNGGRSLETKLGFLQELLAYGAAAQRLGRRIVLCGDLNVARTELDVHPRERNPTLVGQRPEERALFERILTEGNLRDVGRDLDPTTPCSPGGRPGARCANETSAGAWTTSSPRRPWRPGRRAASPCARSAPATTAPSWPSSTGWEVRPSQLRTRCRDSNPLGREGLR